MKTLPGRFYWVIFECRLTIVETTPQGDGFWVFGQEQVWPWGNCIVLCEAGNQPSDELIDSKWDGGLM